MILCEPNDHFAIGMDVVVLRLSILRFNFVAIAPTLSIVQ